jgi:uncharacterized protein (TIGR01777 family)
MWEKIRQQNHSECIPNDGLAPPDALYWGMDRPRLVIAGAGGVVGHHLVAAARERYAVAVLTRRIDGDEPAGTRSVVWNPRAAREGDDAAIASLAQTLSGARAIVNLAGASIADGRLGPDHVARVRDSRTDSAATLAAANAAATVPATAWFQASGVGRYGDRGDEVLTERSGPGDDLLASISRAWEGSATDAAELSRVVVGRIGLVLAADAPAWRRFLLPIRLGAGGRLGSGDQWYAWIDADDLARAILWLLERDDAEGPYNLTAPEPVRQVELSRAAARRLGRPALLRVPAFALRIVLGRVADALLLSSARAVPERLLSEGFTFDTPTLDRAVERLLPR